MSERKPYRCARSARCANRVRAADDSSCSCACHGQSALDRRCDLDGGCGHLHPEAPDFEGGPILSESGLCEACTARVSRALAELPLDYVELNLLLGSGESGIFSDMVLFSRELQVPIRVSVEALQASMAHETQAWAEPVAERLGIDWDTDRTSMCRPGFTLQRAAGLLTNGLGTLLGLPAQEYRHHSSGEWVERDGIAGALELLHLHELTRFAAGKTKLVHKLPTPCPQCEREALCRHNGTEHVVCEGCGSVWPNDQYKRLCLVLAEDYRDLEPARERVHLHSSAEGTTGTVHHAEAGAA